MAGEIPDPDVRAGSDRQDLAVPAVGHRRGLPHARTRAALQAQRWTAPRAVGDVPQLDGGVHDARRQGPTVRMERQAAYPVGVALEDGDAGVAPDAPEDDGLVGTPEARVRPSGLKATPWTSPAWPLRVAMRARRWTSQRMTVSSMPPEARVRPSGLKATWSTVPTWPSSAASAS